MNRLLNILSQMSQQVDDATSIKTTQKARDKPTGRDNKPDTGLKGCKHPSDNIYFQVATASYQPLKQRPKLINNVWQYKKDLSSATVAVYVDELNKSLVIGYRGTDVKNPMDLQADSKIAFNKLNETPRFTSDSQTTNKILEQMGDKYCYFSVGHSLGNAIQLQIDRQFGRFIRSGRGYNGALQPKDVVESPKKFSYWYIKGDPLYQYSGRLLRRNLVVFPRVSKKSIKNHDLANFQGLNKNDALTKGGKKPSSKLPSKTDLVAIGFGKKSQKLVNGRPKPVDDFLNNL